MYGNLPLVAARWLPWWLASTAADMLSNADMRREAGRQLAEFLGPASTTSAAVTAPQHAQQAQQLLTADQLRYSCCCLAVQGVDASVMSQLNQQAVAEATPLPSHMQALLAANDGEAPTASEKKELLAIRERCLAAMLELEPRNPKGFQLAARRAAHSEQQSPPLAVAELYLRAAELDESRGGLYYSAWCAPYAVLHAAHAARAIEEFGGSPGACSAVFSGLVCAALRCHCVGKCCQTPQLPPALGRPFWP